MDVESNLIDLLWWVFALSIVISLFLNAYLVAEIKVSYPELYVRLGEPPAFLNIFGQLEFVAFIISGGFLNEQLRSDVLILFKIMRILTIIMMISLPLYLVGLLIVF